MIGMEHAIEQAARTEADKRHAAAERSLNKSKYGEASDYHANDGHRDGFMDGAEWAVAYLREAGLLAPAPLTEVRADAWEQGYSDCWTYHQSNGLSGSRENPYRQEADQ